MPGVRGDLDGTERFVRGGHVVKVVVRVVHTVPEVVVPASMA